MKKTLIPLFVFTFLAALVLIRNLGKGRWALILSVIGLLGLLGISVFFYLKKR